MPCFSMSKGLDIRTCRWCHIVHIGAVAMRDHVIHKFHMISHLLCVDIYIYTYTCTFIKMSYTRHCPVGGKTLNIVQYRVFLGQISLNTGFTYVGWKQNWSNSLISKFINLIYLTKNLDETNVNQKQLASNKMKYFFPVLYIDQC